MKRVSTFTFAILVTLAAATSAFAQKEAEELQQQIFGKWFIDEDETKKELQKDEKWTDRIVANAMEIIGDMELEIKSDKSLTLKSRGREMQGTWSKPEYIAKTKMLKMVFNSAGQDRKTEVNLKVLKVKNEKRLLMVRHELPPIVFYPAKRSPEQKDVDGKKGDDKKRDAKKGTDKAKGTDKHKQADKDKQTDK